MIPDSSQAIITPVLVLALGFIVSIRVGIILLALTIIGGLILGAMMGEQEFMKIYQESLSKLSAETVEYVRGMQVVKIFKANVESFKSFYKAIRLLKSMLMIIPYLVKGLMFCINGYFWTDCNFNYSYSLFYD